MADDPRLRPFTIQGIQFDAVGDWAYMPTPPVDFYGISSDEPMEVVGESRYQDGIARVVLRWRADGADPMQLLALLVAEPANPFDRHAVRVLLVFDEHHATAGYLPRQQAYGFSEAVKEAADRGLMPALNAQVFGGTPDKPSFGVWLGFPRDRYDADGRNR